MDPSERIVRRGPLSEASLRDAIAAERATGRSVVQLGVGSRELERVALEVLRPAGDALDALRGVVPNVVVDGSLPADGWELREAEHAA